MEWGRSWRAAREALKKKPKPAAFPLVLKVSGSTRPSRGGTCPHDGQGGKPRNMHHVQRSISRVMSRTLPASKPVGRWRELEGRSANEPRLSQTGSVSVEVLTRPDDLDDQGGGGSVGAEWIFKITEPVPEGGFACFVPPHPPSPPPHAQTGESGVEATRSIRHRHPDNGDASPLASGPLAR